MELSITTHAKRIIRVMKNKIIFAREIIKWAQLINFMANLRGGRLIKSMKNKKGGLEVHPGLPIYVVPLLAIYFPNIVYIIEDIHKKSIQIVTEI